jgi:hypothetical protein
LAISQAGAFIHCHSSFNDYLQLFQHEHEHLLQNEEFQDLDPYGVSAYAAWKLIYDKLDASARSFLQICSMLYHEGISEQMFEKASLSQEQLEDPELQNKVTQLLNQLGKKDVHWSSWDFLQVVKCLGSYSLIKYDHSNGTYSVHPLVQHWSRTTMGQNRHFMQKCILSIIGLSVSLTFNAEDYNYR